MRKILVGMLTLVSLSSFSSVKDVRATGPNEKLPCGLQGSVDERIKDCSYSEVEGFVLVTRSKDFKEVHMEVSSGLLWSDRLPLRMNQLTAEQICKVAEFKEFGGIEGKTWRLPSIDEYREAMKNGSRNVLPNTNHWFWSSSVRHLRYDSYAWLFNGFTGSFLSDVVTTHLSVRCVAR